MLRFLSAALRRTTLGQRSQRERAGEGPTH
jgi:hypothetical protein